MHVAANLFNDVFDFYGCVDRPDESGADNPLLTGELSARAYIGAAAGCVAASVGIGIFLCVRHHCAALFWLGAFGVLAAILYSAGKYSPKHWAAGEGLVFLSMGLGMTAGGALTQSADWSWGVLLAGLPAAIGMTLIMFVNNVRDMEADRQAGVRTLANRIGLKKSMWLLTGMITLEFLSLLWAIAAGVLPPMSTWGLPFILILYALALDIRKNGAKSKHLLMASLHDATLGIILLFSLY